MLPLLCTASQQERLTEASPDLAKNGCPFLVVSASGGAMKEKRMNDLILIFVSEI